MMKKKLSLADRYAIRKAVGEMGNIRFRLTKAGEILREKLIEHKRSLGEPPEMRGYDVKGAIEKKNWKMAIVIAVESGPEEEIPERVGRVILEIYRRECTEKDFKKRKDQWFGFVGEIYEGTLTEYRENDEVRERLLDAVKFAKEKIELIELTNARKAR
jgi:hypothetical protein